MSCSTNSVFVTEGTIEIFRIQLSKHRNYEAHFKDCEVLLLCGYEEWRIMHLYVAPEEAVHFHFPYCCKNTFQYKALKALADKED